MCPVIWFEINNVTSLLIFALTLLKNVPKYLCMNTKLENKNYTIVMYKQIVYLELL
jgi:hypothetical protein